MYAVLMGDRTKSPNNRGLNLCWNDVHGDNKY